MSQALSNQNLDASKEVASNSSTSFRELGKYAERTLGKRALRLETNAFAYLDRSDFRESARQQDGTYSMRFYVEGIHCSRCMWLIEEASQHIPHVISIRVNLGKSVAQVLVEGAGSFATVAEHLSQLGYKLRPLENKEEQVDLETQENRAYLYRIGVAAFCAGNIMIMAVAIYGGLEGMLANYFGWLSLALAIPCLTYSAFPFYKNAWNGLKRRSVSIDLPITIAILVGVFDSLRKLSVGNPELFLDSLTILVFLLLMSRYALRKIRQSVFSASHFLKFYQPKTVKRILEDGSDESVEIDLSLVEPQDKIVLSKGEWIPVDGILESKSALVDQSTFNGESVPAVLQKGEMVFAGCRLLNKQIILRCERAGEETRIARLFQRVEENLLRKSHAVTLADHVAQYFVATVLLLAAGLTAYAFFAGSAAFFDRALALVILTCPCALALGTPLAFAIGLGRAAKEGVLIKDGETLERILKVRNLFLDKTGTLTEGKFTVLSMELLQSETNEDEVLQNVIHLERDQAHPVAQAICDYAEAKLSKANGITPKSIATEKIDVKIIDGGGVAAELDGARWEVRPSRAADDVLRLGAFDTKAMTTEILVLRDGVGLARFSCGDSTRPEVADLINRLRQQNLNIHLLSGDQKQPCAFLARQFSIPETAVFAEKSPEEKESIVSSKDNSIMVGDGINDSAAIAKADLGVAIKGGLDASLHAADIYLAEGIQDLPKVFQVAKTVRRTILRNLSLSLGYNAIGGLAAILGFISPLVAAILMPLSSLTVLLSSYWGGRS